MKLHVQWMHESLEGPLDETETYDVHGVIEVDDQLFVHPMATEFRLESSYRLDFVHKWWTAP